jgi:His-Xaa-Ser system protein HxsD
MSNESSERSGTERELLSFRVSPSFVSMEALLKTCYWFSGEFVCEVSDDGNGQPVVSLKPKGDSKESIQDVRERFTAQAMDFALRERVAMKTADVRDLLLAKAFSESGVLEGVPQGIFGDQIEEEKPEGMFKILSNQ